MTTALTFQTTTFDVVDRNGQPWIRGPQIGGALGYGQRGDQIDAPLAERCIRNLYSRHADEFTEAMTAVIKLPTEGGEQDVRIFSLRGCHLLAMFARTKVAKEFRKWVLDVLDSLDKELQPEPQPSLPPTDAPITPDQQCTLQALVKAKVEAIPETDRPKGLYPQIWSRFKNHFRVAKYSQLPQTRMSEAVEYLTKMEIRKPNAAIESKPEEKEDKGALPPSEILPVPAPIDAPKQLDALHKARNACRWEMIPKSYRADDKEAVQRALLGNDLYKLQDALWAALYNVCSAAAHIRDSK